ncbi:hypothetical protein H0R92_12980 [Treponema sp. OMZ 840]|uniref:hypothetical protein n=1 Tax=Treponema sp. OMZ 840 TaxID=244313 RepID=UPI003D92FFDF
MSVFFIFTGIFFIARYFNLAIAGSRHTAEPTLTAQDTVFLYVAAAAKGFLFALSSLIVNAIIHLKNKNHKPMAAAFVLVGFGTPFLVASEFLFGVFKTLENLHSQNIAVSVFFIYVNALFKFCIGTTLIGFIPYILFTAIHLFRDKRKLLFLSVFFIISGCIAIPAIIDQKHMEDKLYSFDLNADGIFAGKEVTPEQQEWMRKYTHDIPVMLLYAAAAPAGFICAIAALIVNETEKRRKKKNGIPLKN